MYVAKIWVNENDIPDTVLELANFDVARLIPLYKEYKAQGGNAHMEADGQTLYEAWASSQLFLRKKFSVLMNEKMPMQSIGRLSRITLLESKGIIETIVPCLLSHISDTPELNRQHETISALIYDGSFGHAISLEYFLPDSQSIVFWDPWPDRSLLCVENNSAGVAAQAWRDEKRLWVLSCEEFTRILYAIILPTADLAGTVYGEYLDSLENLQKTDLFSFFNIHEIERLRASNDFVLIQCKSGGFHEFINISFLIDPSDFVHIATLELNCDWFAQGLSSIYFAADIAKSFLLTFEQENDSGQMIELLAGLIIQVWQKPKPFDTAFARCKLKVVPEQREASIWLVMKFEPLSLIWRRGLESLG